MASIRFEVQNVTFNGELALRFRRYLKRVWRDQYGAPALIIRRAVGEFLDREEKPPQDEPASLTT